MKRLVRVLLIDIKILILIQTVMDSLINVLMERIF